MHFRLEIRDKPTGAAIRYQPCLERGTSRACAPAQLLADSGAGGVYTWSQALGQWTPGTMAWTTRPDRFVLVLQDAYGRPIVPASPGNPNPFWVGQPFVSLYYPMSVRFSAAVTPQGAALPGWPGLIPTAVRQRAGYVMGDGRRAGGLCRAEGPGRAAAMALPAGPGGARDLRGRWMPAGED